MNATKAESGNASSILGDLPPMFDTPTLARVLATSNQRLIDMRSKGTGPAFHRLGRSVRYSRDSVAAWLTENQHTKA